MPWEPQRQRKLARGLGLASGLVVVVCLVWLIADFAVTVGRVPSEKGRVEELETQVKTDFEIATALHEERERQTQVSLVREDRNRVLAWVLLVAAGVFVASGKWFMSLRPQKLPRLEELVAERFAPTTPRDAPLPEAPPRAEQGIDLSFVDDLVARFGTGREAAIPMLQAIQNHYRYLPDEALRRACELTEITAAQIAGTSSFYAQFRRSPVGRYVVRVCHGTACHVAGADQITSELRRHLDIAVGEDTDRHRRFTIDSVACLGCCSLAPVMMIEQQTAGRLTPATARQALDAVGSA